MRDDPGEMFLMLISRIFLPLHLCPLLQIHDILYLFLCNTSNRMAFNIRCWRRLLRWMRLHKRLSNWLSLVHRANWWSLARKARRLRSIVLRNERRGNWWLLLMMLAE